MLNAPIEDLTLSSMTFVVTNGDDGVVGVGEGKGEGLDEDEALLCLQSLLHPSATPAIHAWQQSRYTPLAPVVTACPPAPPPPSMFPQHQTSPHEPQKALPDADSRVCHSLVSGWLQAVLRLLVCKLHDVDMATGCPCASKWSCLHKVSLGFRIFM